MEQENNINNGLKQKIGKIISEMRLLKKMPVQKALYILVPYRLKQKLLERKLKVRKNKDLFSKRAVKYPAELDLDRILDEEFDKCISFLPYCAKPRDCPINDTEMGRKNQQCLRKSGRECDRKCSMGRMIDAIKESGMPEDRIFIIDADANLFEWLKQKRKEGYKYFFPAVACSFGVGYAFDMICQKLGFQGLVVFIDDADGAEKGKGVCRSKDDYLNMEYGDKGHTTKVCECSIDLVSRIFKKRRIRNSVSGYFESQGSSRQDLPSCS